MVCANSSTKDKRLYPSSTFAQIGITFGRHIVFFSIFCSFRFDTVCSVFSILPFVCSILTSIGSECPLSLSFVSTSSASTSWNSSIYLPMFLFWFREWIISIFMSFQHMFSFFFLNLFRFIFLLSFCLPLLHFVFIVYSLCGFCVYTFCMWRWRHIFFPFVYMTLFFFLFLFLHLFSFNVWFSFRLFKLGRCKAFAKLSNVYGIRRVKQMKRENDVYSFEFH